MGYFVLALFCVWAALSAGLALWYGSQKRPADRLDGYTMLRKGAGMADELKGNEEFMSGKPFQHRGTLRRCVAADFFLSFEQRKVGILRLREERRPLDRERLGAGEDSIHDRVVAIFRKKELVLAQITVL